MPSERSGAPSAYRALVEALGDSDPDALDELRARQPAVVEAFGEALRRRMSGPEGADSLPEQVGPYRIIRLLGRGGMGDVYLAHAAGGAPVALKVIRWDKAGQPQLRRRFEKEQAIARDLQHPNILNAIDVGEHDGVLYYTMRFIDGARTLEALIEEGAHDPARAARLVARCAGAIGWLHDRGILHRDLKPGNVLVSPAGEPFIIDFGLAKDLLETQGPWLTTTGVGVGTLGYCAPEQASGGGASPASDIYGLGATLYARLTGELPVPPRPDEAQAAYLARLIKEEPIAPHLRHPAISPKLSAIVMKCLEKRPHRRYRSARDVQGELDRYTLDQPIEARLKGRARRLLHRILDQPGARLLAGALLIGLVAVSAMATLATLGERRLARQIAHDLGDLAERTAGEIGNSIEFWSGSLEQQAQDQRIIQALGAVERARETEREAALARLQRLFEGIQPVNLRQTNRWSLLDVQGRMLARTPFVAAAIGQSFDKRDYLEGALRHAGWEGRRAVHVSAGYVSRVDGSELVDISVGVRDAAGTPRAVLTAGVTIGVDLGTRRMVGKNVSLVLLVPWDESSRAERGATPSQRHLVLVHPLLHRNDSPVPYDSSFLPAAVRRFPAARCDAELSFEGLPAAVVVSDHRDPVRGGDSPPLQAAFAPIGHSGMILLLQREP